MLYNSILSVCVCVVILVDIQSNNYRFHSNGKNKGMLTLCWVWARNNTARFWLKIFPLNGNLL